ncbi:MAG TPA: ABC transporter permease subunit [Gallionellaceae bacterium]|nr:ABC transporter permease subunit [Gallionellaceae bacterium]HQS76040.1 ABC transporter permease subunit [Gallionellaceae bacterium]
MTRPDTMILTIAHKEFRSLFATPSTWFILGGLQFIFAWFFLARLDAYLQVQAQLVQLANPPGATHSVAAPVLATIGFILMMLVPIFTMRLVAEERRNQTLVLLMASPVASWEIIAGKFLGMLLFLSLIIAASFLMLLTLALGTPLDYGLLITNAAGLFMLAAGYSALGLYFSTLTTQPVVAASSTIAALFGLWLIDVAGSSTGTILKALSPTVHFQSFNTGLLLSKDITYFLLFSAICLLLAIRRLNNSRIYG